jgi:hypothetical protein
MHPTTFVYSSHNCSPYMHRTFIVQRALEVHHDKRLLYLPMSEWPVRGDNFESQKFGYDKVSWYLDQFRDWGLRPQPFYWSDHLSNHDIGLLFEMIQNAPVVVLGGGNTRLGMRRYQALGARFNGDPNLFCRLLHERQMNGKLTVGYSAGADQLTSIFGGAPYAEGRPCEGFGLARDVAVTLHHDWSRMDELYAGAGQVQHGLWFGLPNDSGLAVNTGTLPNGLIWQMLRFVIDNSWDLPSDHHHIKTRQGMKIDHVYADGRTWAFNGGDAMLRVMAADGSYRNAWIFSGGSVLDYDSQWPSRFESMPGILQAHC